MIIKAAKRLASVQEYYFSQKLLQIKKLESEGKKIINLGIGSPDMMPSENTVNELIRWAKNENSHGYQSYRGIPELRKAIANFYKETYSTELNSDTEILPLLGSKEGIMHISLAFLNKGDKVLVPDPGYPTYTSVSKLTEAKIISYSLKEKNNWLPDIKQLERMNLKGVKLMWLNYPNMPTGAEANDECFIALIAFARKHKILLCHDNPYSLILNTKRPKSIFDYEGAKEVAVELNSLSKSHNMAGWRVGWVCGSKEYIDTILKVKSNMDSGMFLSVQKAAAEALNNLPSWHTKRNEEYEKRREKVWELLMFLQCDFSIHQTGMFVWAKVNKEIKSIEDFTDKILLEAGVFITPGLIFGKNGERYIRVSLCSKQEVIDEALKRVKQFMNRQKNTSR